MKKAWKFLTVAACAAMAFSCIGTVGFLQASAEEAPSETKWENPDWKDGSGDPTATYDSETGLTHIERLTSGASSTYGYKVHLDGLEVHYKIGREGTRNTSGFAFSNLETCTTDTEPWHTGASFGMSVWPKTYRSPGQTRVYFGKAVTDQESGNILYKDQNLETKGFGSNACYICGNDTDLELKLTFHKLSVEGKDVWSIDVEPLMQVKPVGGTSNDTTGYFDGSNLNDVLDENGDAYFVALGYTGDEGTLNDCYFALKDNNSKAYAAGELATANTNVEAYKTAIEAITDADTFEASRTAYTAAVSSLEALRGNDKVILNNKIAEYDKLYTTNEDVQAKVKAALQTSFTAATAKVDVLDAEEGITETAIGEAKTAAAAAQAAYDEMKNMLTAENDEEFTALLEGYIYDIDLATAKAWVIAYEKMVNALDTTAPESLTQAIVDVKAYYAGYEESEAKTIITTKLEEGDKTALEGRITTSKTKFDGIEAGSKTTVQDYYLSEFEATVAEGVDLTIAGNIANAKTKLTAVTENLTGDLEIKEADGEIYTRYTAAYTTLKEACEAFVNAQITSVESKLGPHFENYNEFNPIKTEYLRIKMNFLLEENAEVQAAYDALTEKMEAETWYWFNEYKAADSFGNAVQNSSGIYLNEVPVFPARLNYNKPLSMVEGIDITVELTAAAFYNDNSAANNLLFNFLEKPDSYKSMCDGLSVMIWLYPAESNVQLYNNNDIPIMSKSIATPMDGETIEISLKYDEEYYDFAEDKTYAAYVLTVNEATFVLTHDLLIANASAGDDGTQLGGTMSKDIVYFSMGSFADKKEVNNEMTLISVNDESFGYTEPVSGVTVTANKTSVKAGEQIVFTAATTPVGSIGTTYEWYVNDAKQTAVTASFTFTPDKEGEYKVYCKVDGISSAVVTVTAAKASETDPGTNPGGDNPGTNPGGTTPGETDNGGGCGSIAFAGIGGAVALITVLAAGSAVLFARKRHE